MSTVAPQKKNKRVLILIICLLRCPRSRRDSSLHPVRLTSDESPARSLTYADLSSLFVLDLSVIDNEITIIGEGNTPLPFTSREDVSRFVAHALVRQFKRLPCPNTLDQHSRSFPSPPIDFPKSQLLSLGTLRLQASHISFNALAATYPGVTVKHESHDVALKRFQEEGDFLAWLKVEWDAGRGANGGDANQLWADWNPKGVETFL